MSDNARPIRANQRSKAAKQAGAPMSDMTLSKNGPSVAFQGDMPITSQNRREAAKWFLVMFVFLIAAWVFAAKASTGVAFVVLAMASFMGAAFAFYRLCTFSLSSAKA